MTFIRKKNINGTDYAYLVNNRWTKKGSRQKAKYLGKLVNLGSRENGSFTEYLRAKGEDTQNFFKSNTKIDILKEYVKFEIIVRGFKSSQTKLSSDELILNNGKYCYKDGRLVKLSTGKEIIAEMNEGFLCSLSLKFLVELKPIGYDEREQGIMLAKAFLEAGLKADQETFLLIFEKWTQK